MGHLLHDRRAVAVPVATLGELRQERARPACAQDAALDVVAGPVAADVGPRKLDRLPSAGVRDALDDQCRRPGCPREEPGLASAEKDRLDCLTSPHHHRPVALGEDVVEGVALEIDVEQSGKTLCRQPDKLQQEWLVVGKPQALEEDERRSDPHAERRGGGLTRRLLPGGDQARCGLHTAALHLLREAEATGEVAIHAGCEDGGPAPAGALDAALARQFGERVPDRDQAAAVALGEFPLRRETVAGAPLAAVERGGQVEIDLVMQRNRSGLEPEPRHPTLSASDLAIKT
jgi:hypothetical protein